MTVKKIDSHVHFWQYQPKRDAWITEEMQVIRRDFMPEDLKPLMDQLGIEGCMAVQADQSEQETQFLLELAGQYPFIHAVTGWVDLQSDGLAERLEYYSQFPKLKGFRHIVQAEPDPDFLNRPAFRRGIALLQQQGYLYEILIYPSQLPAALQLVRQFPDMVFVLDHLGKPNIVKGEMEPWATEIRALGRHENVYCKLSGMATEADWKVWKPAQFQPYFETALEAFGPQRLMFGSDWPVCLLSASYPLAYTLAQNLVQALSPTEQAEIMGGNLLKITN